MCVCVCVCVCVPSSHSCFNVILFFSPHTHTPSGYIPDDWLHIAEAKKRYFESSCNLLYALEIRRDATSATITDLTARARLSRAREVLTSGLRSYRKDPRVTIPELERMLCKLLEEVTAELGGAENVCDRADWEALPMLAGESESWAQPDCPYLAQAPPDLFAALGPLYFFNSLCALSNKRWVWSEGEVEERWKHRDMRSVGEG